MTGNGLFRTHGARWAGEFVVIVVGILAALAVDGWVQAREDREAEAMYVERLIADLRWDLEEIEQSRRSGESLQASASWLLRELGTPRSSLTDVSPRFRLVDSIPAFEGVSVAEIVVMSMQRQRQMDHRRSTWDELLATGGVRVIRNTELRAALAEYYALVESMMDAHVGNLEVGAELAASLRDRNILSVDVARLPDPIATVFDRPEAVTRLRLVQHRPGVAVFMLAGIEVAARELKAGLEVELESLR